WRLLLGDSSAGYAEVAAILSAGATLVPVAWALRKPLDTTSKTFAPLFAILVLATVLISPHLLAYDLTLLLLPMGLALCSRPLPSGARARDPVWLLTGIVYAVASLSRLVAAASGIQIIVPVLMVYLIVLAGTEPTLSK